jgi:uncharacterized protein YndB with AHSA1/START domain
MSKHEKPSFSYVTYIGAAPDRVWQALTDGALTRQYWYGRRVESDWKVGSTVTFWYDAEDGEAVSDRGIVLESRPPRHLSYTFHVEFVDELKDEHPSRVTFDLEPIGDGCRTGWPAILSSLKSLVETGEPLAISSAAAAVEAAEAAA